MINYMLKSLKYVNIAFAVFILYNTIAFAEYYFFDESRDNEIKKLEIKKEKNSKEINIIKKAIEHRTAINKDIINQSYIKNEDFASILASVVGEITDKELGLFSVQSISQVKSDDFINLYIASVEINYIENVLFTFESLKPSLEKEFNRNIAKYNKENKENMEVMMIDFVFNNETSNLTLNLNIRKNVTRT
ncbi:hypothetical protein [Poseidonibacter ostreae]|uniref:Uncharacterized protein n=1 Tax=Poseidonibacter ostreae TaxID=2654171 RepID=A0A6L4WWU3_9BACT|nr:hypothetical protein [Poseidonibacter ostreae]KAB7891329.1 hypothetical protein GBG19_00400 [Poseidonibacter ostreae]